ncbi:MAG: ABC transporter ATP-binding protein [Flavobacteriia bacterium]|nr:ABC transporter ATP-binding protein [Flavobacteriia bacterium]OJX36966.1 MAG: ABC transporter [Flavobacteriia bacterium 40-80]
MNSLRYLNKYLLKYKWRIWLGILCIIASNLFGVMMPKVVGDAVNGFKDDIAAHVPANDILWGTFMIAGFYMLLNIGKGFFLFLTRQTIIIMSRLVEYDLKNEIYEHYQKLDFGFYKKNRIGDLMNRISEDVSQVRQYLGPGLMYNINLLVLFPLCIYWMMQTNVKLTLLVLTPLPLLSYIIYKVSSKINYASRKVQEEQSRISSITQENFSGIRILKAYLREEESKQKFNESAEAYKGKTMKMVLLNSLFMPSITFLIALSVLLSIYVGGLMTYTNEIQIGDIIAFIMYVNMLTWPFASVGWVTSIIQRAAASQERINEFLKLQPEIVNTVQTPLSSIDSIRFENVSFTYENSGITALKDLNFSIRKGEKIGIIGKTGSGKTSILYLLTRQFDATKGTVFINETPIQSINLDAYRRKFGVVPQEVFLFSDSIRNNIAFGINDAEITDEELINVTKQAHVYHNIERFPEKFDTVLGERGVNLSGGQKQRISIARALIRKPELLLLDDCLSAVDTETEEIILKSLDELQNQTVVIVSHRISSLRFTDRILVIEDGVIVENGSHEDLLQKEGAYYEMYLKQLAE